MKEKNVYLTILIISIVCVALSITIQTEKKQYSSNQESICSAITGSNGCETVQTSKYASIFGIDNPIFGIIGFSLLVIFSSISMTTSIKPLKYLILTGSIIAGLTAIWFLYLQILVINRYCIFCLMVDILSLILLGIAICLLYNTALKHK